MSMNNLNYVSNGGSVMILSNGDDSKPVYNLLDGVEQQITYTAPKLYSDSYFPLNSTDFSAEGLYGDVTLGATTYHHVFKNPLTEGQPVYWRVSFSYVNKVGNLAFGIGFRQHYSVFDWSNTVLTTTPAGALDQNNMCAILAGFSDENSMPPNDVNGFNLYVTSNNGDLDITINHIVRLCPQYYGYKNGV